MASPIYFFPNARRDDLVKPMTTRLDPAFLAAHGVAASFAGIHNALAQTSLFELGGKGPGGACGLMVSVMPAGDAPARIGFHPEFQTWHERPAGCDCWIGIDKEQPPTPAELAHVARPQGTSIELGDGNLWRVPIVRSPFVRDELGRSQLPRDFTFDASGQFRVERTLDTDALWELSGVAWDHFFGELPTVDLEQMVDLVLQTLALNYRVGRAEQQALRLVNSSNWDQCVRIILDVPLIDEALASEKKTEQPPAVA